MNTDDRDHDLMFMGYHSGRYSELLREEYEKRGGLAGLSLDERSEIRKKVNQSLNDEIEEMIDIDAIMSPRHKLPLQGLIITVLRIQQRIHDEVAKQGGRETLSNKDYKDILARMVALDYEEKVADQQKQQSSPDGDHDTNQ